MRLTAAPRRLRGPSGPCLRACAGTRPPSAPASAGLAAFADVISANATRHSARQRGARQEAPRRQAPCSNPYSQACLRRPAGACPAGRSQALRQASAQAPTGGVSPLQTTPTHREGSGFGTPGERRSVPNPTGPELSPGVHPEGQSNIGASADRKGLRPSEPPHEGALRPFRNPQKSLRHASQYF